MATKFDICSMAFAALDADAISSFEDGTKEALLAAQTYDLHRRAALSEHFWNFNTSTIEMGREPAGPTDSRWLYKFVMPVDWLRTTGCFDENFNPVDYIEEDKRIYSNSARTFIKYQKDVIAESMPDYFQAYLVARLAAEWAKPIGIDTDYIASYYADMATKFKRACNIDSQSNQSHPLFTKQGSRWLAARRGGYSW